MGKSAHRWTFFVLAAAAVVFSALSPWIRTRLRFPDDSFDVSVIYRSHVGDIQYFPLIAELSRGSFTDETIKELKGSQILSFPTASMLPHALGFALFDAHGFMVADVVVAILYFSCVVAFFRVLGASWSASTIGSLFVSLSVPLELSILADLGPMVTKLPIMTRLWGLRIPRPFVSELFIVLSFVVSLRIMASNDRGRAMHWVAIAVAYALLLQSDLHAAMIFAFASPFLLYGIVKERGVSQTLYGVVWAGLLFTILASHFVLSRLTENPEIPIRWGVFALNRLGGFDRDWMRHLPQVCLTILAVYFTARYFDQNSPKSPESTQPLPRAMPYVLVLLLAAYFAKPLSILILGKTVQPYHFDDRTSRICTYFLVGVVLLWVDWGVQRFARRSAFIQYRLGTAAACLQATCLVVACAYVFLITFLYSGGRVDRAHLRSAYYTHAGEAEPHYRRNFTELAAYLKENVKPDAVIATFDDQVYSWWMTFHEGYSYLVEPFVSCASDKELEDRLAALCRLLGMSTEQYLKFIQNDYVNTFFLGCAKYQASAWRRYSTLDDYTDEQKQTFLKSRDVWNVAIPQSELRRLEKSYEAASAAPGAERELDVIVLSNFGPEKELAPPEENWTPAFENNAFRVYRARGIETPGSPR